MTPPRVSELLSRTITGEEYHTIKQLWQIYSIAEDRRELDGLISTMTEDCIYKLAQTGKQWHGHEGARQFYTELLTSFPDIHFDLQHIVIGPQGVFEEAGVTATHKGRWMNFEPTDQKIVFRVLILFPWNSSKKTFEGERVWFQL